MSTVLREDPESNTYLLKQILKELQTLNRVAAGRNQAADEAEVQTTKDADVYANQIGGGAQTEPRKPGPGAVPGQGDAQA